MTRKPMYRRLWAALILCLIFLRELSLSALNVARVAFGKKIELAPAILEVPVNLRTDLGVATVANLISLTPGTTTLHTNEDGTILYVHCMNVRSQKEEIESIKRSFEYWVREVEG